MKTKLGYDLTYAVITGLLMFLVVPVSMVGHSPLDFSFHQTDVFSETGILFSL